MSSTSPALGPDPRSFAMLLAIGVAPRSPIVAARSSSATWNARSSDWRAFSRGSHIVSYRCSRCVVEHLLGAAEALGDVLAGQLDVHAAGPHAGGLAGGEEAAQLAHHVVEAPCLVTALVHERVPVHRVARPHDGVAGHRHRPQQRRQRLLDAVGAHPAEEHEPPGLAARVRGARRARRTSSGVARRARASRRPGSARRRGTRRGRRRAGGCARRPRAGGPSSRTSRR